MSFDWGTQQFRGDRTTLLLYRHERIFEEGLIHPGMRVLDVGGWGMLALRLIEEGCDAFVLDKFTEDQAYTDRVRGLPHIEADICARDIVGPFVVSGLTSLLFDVVTCFETLEHVADAKAAIRNMYKLLRPGGTLVGTVPIPGGTHPATDDVRFFEAEELAWLLGVCGFDTADVEPTASIKRDGRETSLYFKARKA